MGHAHGHLHGDDHSADGISAVPVRLRRILVGAVGAVVVATIAGLIALWPGSNAGRFDRELFGEPAELMDGTVVGHDEVVCAGTPPEAGLLCIDVDVEVTSGSRDGDVVSLEQAPGDVNAPVLSRGDRIVLGYNPPPPGESERGSFYLADYQRRTPMLWLALLFAVAVVALGRWRGVRALVGLVITLLVLVWFVLPAILEGSSPVLVAIVGSAAVMVVTLYLAHGFNLQITTALLGTLASLALTGVLAALFVEATQLTGLVSEEARFLRLSAEAVNVEGLLLAGIIIGTLGVLDDVTITQAAAVWELHRANPAYGPVALYRAGVRIGRDHIASTVNTLVLAYAGASLPLLILFRQTERPLDDVLTGEVIAVEIVRTLVGSVGLVASVPLTTGLAAAVVAGVPTGGWLGGERRGPARRWSERLPRWPAPRERTWAPPRAERVWRDAGAGEPDGESGSLPE